MPLACSWASLTFNSSLMAVIFFSKIMYFRLDFCCISMIAELNLAWISSLSPENLNIRTIYFLLIKYFRTQFNFNTHGCKSNRYMRCTTSLATSDLISVAFQWLESWIWHEFCLSLSWKMTIYYVFLLIIYFWNLHGSKSILIHCNDHEETKLKSN